ncbi:hypothetical protein GF325_03450 [Candidatus Bathyarchaeota archaeon]|nr:hypothetical protein [Candidatus Bathyarchaeota archaeon]
MDIETMKGMRLSILGTGASFIVSLIAYIMMASSGPASSYSDYESFLRMLIVATMIQFVVLPVLLAFFVNDAGELENFTRTGLIEKAWLINTIGVIVQIAAAVLLGYAMASMFVGFSETPDPGIIYGNMINMMTTSQLIQSLGFSIPVFYFLLSKYMAREKIPFKKIEQISDIIGILFSVVMPLPSIIIFSSGLAVGICGMLGIISMIIGITWIATRFQSSLTRDLPDIPED